MQEFATPPKKIAPFVEYIYTPLIYLPKKHRLANYKKLTRLPHSKETVIIIIIKNKKQACYSTAACSKLVLN